MIYLSETASSIAFLCIVLAFSLLSPAFVRSNNQLHRTLILSIAIILGLRYLWWRATETIAPFGFTLDCLASWSFLGFEIASSIGSFSAFVMLMRNKDRTEEATKNKGWWRSTEPPKVALLIATYNEEYDVLEKTITGALGLQYTNKSIYVLDDGRRTWLQEYCDKQGVNYISRLDNLGAKAGNINNALKILQKDPPDFIAILDADFVPHRGFLTRTLSLFHDNSVGLVQTPQHFFNADPIQHNLNVSRFYPDEQRFFFDTLQPARDAWDIAFCCGTSSVARWTAIQEINGFPTESVTEDFMITLVLQNAGWRTVYLNEALTEGLAPEGLKEYITQRARWCLGMMQIAHSSVGPFSKSKIRLRDRWSVLDAGIYWLTTYPFRIAALLYPLLYWYFNVIVVDARIPEVIAYFGVYYFWTLITLNIIAPGKVIPLLTDVSQLIGSLPIAQAALTGLFKPHGHSFKVTAKGGDRSKLLFQWKLMAPFALILCLTIIGVSIGIVSDRFAFYDAGEGKAVILFWTIYNIFLLLLTIVVSIELPRKERHVTDQPEKAELFDGYMQHSVWLTDLTSTDAKLPSFSIPEGSHVIIQIQGVGEVEAVSYKQSGDDTHVQLLLTREQFELLTIRLYADDKVPGILTSSVSGIILGIARRLAFMD